MTTKDWRYYEKKMNECFENGDPDKALAYKEKFVSLYRTEQQGKREKDTKAPLWFRYAVKKLEVPKVYNPQFQTGGFTIELSLREKIRRSWLYANFSEFKGKYEELLPTMGSEELKKFNTPIDAFDMLDLFIKRFFDQGRYGEATPILERGDFKLFDEMVKKELHFIGDIKKRIRVFADGGNEKYEEACISILTGFEWDFSILKSIKKTSVIFRHIQREGYLEQVENIPSKKIMCGWIDAYRTQFYPDWEED